jgi:hypothetical protein
VAAPIRNPPLTLVEKSRQIDAGAFTTGIHRLSGHQSSGRVPHDLVESAGIRRFRTISQVPCAAPAARIASSASIGERQPP